MKILILLVLVVASQATAQVYHPVWWPSSSTYQAKDNSGNYASGQQNDNLAGPSFQSQTGDISGRKVGSYGVKFLDGKVQVVDYVADQGGYRANIRTSEKLDKDHQDPAHIKVSEIQHGAPGAPFAYAHPFANPHYASYPYFMNV